MWKGGAPFQHGDPWRPPNANGTQVGGRGCEPGGTEKHEGRTREACTRASRTTDTTTDQSALELRNSNPVR